MNDRYLFRAKRIDDGERVEGYYACYPHGIGSEDRKDHVIRCVDGYIYFIDPSTICQCTGIKDRNGQLIWENDIIQCNGIITAVSWNTKFASWVLIRKGWMYHHFFGESHDPEECEVIGNIFDNPELLEAGKEASKYGDQDTLMPAT